MPFLEDAQPRLHYRLDGRPGSPLLVSVTAIAGAQWALLQARHIANVEQPQAFNRAVKDFLRA